jgi:glycosyltransferase involved in cell wall biosynthesis
MVCGQNSFLLFKIKTMLSICIPVYNFDVTGLIDELYKQAEILSVPFEIVCIDDCSDSNFISINKEKCNKYGRFIELGKNIGRSKIRNLFLSNTKYQYLLFLDCDSTIVSDNFVKTYIAAVKNIESGVICGGRVYDDEKPSRQYLLRWKYGRLKESQPVEIRQTFPNKSFMTNNFIIDRSVFEIVRFDETISTYGHEDTLFGFQLKNRKIPIAHINNPVLNGCLETNEEYIEKTEIALENLAYILDYLNYNPRFIEDVKIANYYETFLNWKLKNLVKFFYLIFGPLIRKLLKSGIINLFLFDFYKLGFLTKHIRTYKYL